MKYTKLFISLFLITQTYAAEKKLASDPLVPLFDKTQFLKSSRYDAETKDSEGAAVEYSLWVDSSDDKKSYSTLYKRVPAQGSESYLWLNSNILIDKDHIGLEKGAQIPLDCSKLEKKRRSGCKALFNTTKAFSSKLYVSDYENESDIKFDLHLRVDTVNEPVNNPLQVSAYLFDNAQKTKALLSAMEVCDFVNVILNETTKKLNFQLKKSNAEGECTETFNVELSL